MNRRKRRGEEEEKDKEEDEEKEMTRRRSGENGDKEIGKERLGGSEESELCE